MAEKPYPFGNHFWLQACCLLSCSVAVWMLLPPLGYMAVTPSIVLIAKPSTTYCVQRAHGGPWTWEMALKAMKGNPVFKAKA